MNLSVSQTLHNYQSFQIQFINSFISFLLQNNENSIATYAQHLEECLTGLADQRDRVVVDAKNSIQEIKTLVSIYYIKKRYQISYYFH